MAKKKFPLSDKERDEFKKVVSHIKRLKQDKAGYTTKPPKKPLSAPTSDEPAFCEPEDMLSTSPISSKETISFSRSGVQQNVLRKLRRGQYPIQAKLDLHGFTKTNANIALQKFFAKVQAQELRYVQIIHGKGAKKEDAAPILKNYVNQLLRALPFVLAFSSSLPQDGGTGAVYVLLKSQRKINR